MNLKICHVLLVWPNRTLVRSTKPHIESLSGWRVADWWSFPLSLGFLKLFFLVSSFDESISGWFLFFWNNETRCVHFFQHHKWGKSTLTVGKETFLMRCVMFIHFHGGKKTPGESLRYIYIYIFIYTPEAFPCSVTRFFQGFPVWLCHPQWGCLFLKFSTSWL